MAALWARALDLDAQPGQLCEFSVSRLSEMKLCEPQQTNVETKNKPLLKGYVRVVFDPEMIVGRKL